MLSGDIANDPHFVRREIVDAGYRAFLAIPMALQGRPVGVLCVAYRDPERLGERHNRLLSRIANELAIAVQNALLHEALRRAEEKYRGIFDNAVVGIFQSTPNGQFVSVNSAMARMLAYESPTELIATIDNVAEQLYVVPSRWAELVNLLEQDGTVSDFEIEMYRKDGGRIWASLNGRAIRDAAGKVVLFEGVVEDITERKQAEEALEAERQRLQTLVETAPIGGFLVNASGNVLLINPEAQRILGNSDRP